ncbi:MAG TPA: hypothetical protein VF060_11285 [Trebonia sp.]
MEALPDASDTVVVVDVANVMGSRADGWWRDRAGAALRLYEEIAALAARGIAPSQLPAVPPPLPASPARPASSAPVTPVSAAPAPAIPATPASPAVPGEAVEEVVYPWFVLVLEGRARDAVERIEAPHPRLRVVRAAGSGDDAIVTETASLAASGGSCLVVTADRELRRRCVAAGASVVGPSWLLGLF